MEEGDTPSLFISPYYRKLFQNADTSEETREYIKRKINSAQWLIDSIEQRRSTLTKVARAIVDYQKQFLDKGPEAIEPLKMQQIADKVGVHVTTVSRAVDEKWIQTPRGIFPLKRFFCGGTTSADGEEVAWDTVRLKLQEIVDSEDKQHPWSDDQLVQQLAAARNHRRPANGDEVSQSDGHSQFPPAPRLGQREETRRGMSNGGRGTRHGFALENRRRDCRAAVSLAALAAGGLSGDRHCGRDGVVRVPHLPGGVLPERHAGNLHELPRDDDAVRHLAA